MPIQYITADDFKRCYGHMWRNIAQSCSSNKKCVTKLECTSKIASYKHYTKIVAMINFTPFIFIIDSFQKKSEKYKNISKISLHIQRYTLYNSNMENICK